jgi:hypothetical protein
MNSSLRALLLLSVIGAASTACGDDDKPSTDTGHPDASAGDAGDNDAGSEPSYPPRAQDSRDFTIDESTLPFDALPDQDSTSRISGVLDGAGYRIEIPQNWNGILVMYAHGYVGTGAALSITTPSIRQHLIEQGYAWAASSYSKNYYDVQAGIEDTNKLALAFQRIAGENGRTIDAPSKRYLIGHSMGGHITAAAIEREAQTTAINKVKYQAALPMCGVVGDTSLFNYFGGYQATATQLSGVPASDDWSSIVQPVQDALFTTFPSATTEAGDKLSHVVENLTGGKRVMFDLGFAYQPIENAVWMAFGGDGTINGILDRSIVDTSKLVFQLDDDPAVSADEKALNSAVPRVTPAAGANGLRSSGLRYIPVVNGEFDIPVVTLHTLGDVYVPFWMEQLYRQRAVAKGTADKLVQRVVRGTSHCEFTLAEQNSAFDALANWEQHGVKPDGDEVLDRTVVSADDYGCKFTDNTITDAPGDATAKMLRPAAPPCP